MRDSMWIACMPAGLVCCASVIRTSREWMPSVTTQKPQCQILQDFEQRSLIGVGQRHPSSVIHCLLDRVARLHDHDQFPIGL